MTVNLERAALKSRLEGAKNELDRLEVKADALVAEIRNEIYAEADSVTDMDTSKALILMEELHKLNDEAVSLKSKIRKLEGALNG